MFLDSLGFSTYKIIPSESSKGSLKFDYTLQYNKYLQNIPSKYNTGCILVKGTRNNLYVGHMLGQETSIELSVEIHHVSCLVEMV